MNNLLWTEMRKLRRSKIIWIAFFATVMVAFIVFVQGQFSFGGIKYIDSAEWYMTAAQSLGTFFVLPAIIALFGGYMICRETQEDTLKSLKLIPIDEMRLTFSKMLVTLFFSMAIYFCLFAITFFTEAILHFEALTFNAILKYISMYLVSGAGVFCAVLPIIAFVALIKKGYWLSLVFTEIYSFAALFFGMSKAGTVYPIVAVFNLSGYYEASSSEKIFGILSLLVCMVLAGAILMKLKNQAQD